MVKKKCKEAWYCKNCKQNSHDIADLNCRCKLRKWDEKCPEEKPGEHIPPPRRSKSGRLLPDKNQHHVIPDRCWKDKNRKRADCAPSRAAGLCICVRGHGLSQEHGVIHGKLDKKLKALGAKADFDAVLDACAQAIEEGMAAPKCKASDIKKQVSAMKSMNGGELCKKLYTGPKNPMDPKDPKRKKPLKAPVKKATPKPKGK